MKTPGCRVNVQHFLDLMGRREPGRQQESEVVRLYPERAPRPLGRRYKVGPGSGLPGGTRGAGESVDRQRLGTGPAHPEHLSSGSGCRGMGRSATVALVFG